MIVDIFRQSSEVFMKRRPDYMENPDKYDVATEVLSSAINVLKATGFYEEEVLLLFKQISMKKPRSPVFLEPV
ncbi:MAG: hypothetical protein JSR61_09345 [Proteobacteria bacterium]|nr:hypothetical protein [Pseudomonadota bacterium]